MSVSALFQPEFTHNYTKTDIENIFSKRKNVIQICEKDKNSLLKMFKDSEATIFKTRRDYEYFIRTKRKEYKIPIYSKIKMIKLYRSFIENNLVKFNKSLFKFLKLKSTRGWSGVDVITVFTAGHLMGSTENNIKRGGCPMDCHYCPLEVDEKGNPTQPRSYLSTEPGNMRATENKHHPFGQAIDRLYQLELMGHISSDPKKASKCEFIISGGTFNFYPKDYIEWFVTCLYYACNIYFKCRNFDEIPMKSLEEEQKINEEASIRMIGLTIETRPDYVAPKLKNKKDINLDEIRFFRKLGVTRVQVGIQHTDAFILKKINRQCTPEQNKEGIRILKQNGFKTDIHIMFDLPGSTPEKDIECINTIVNDPDYQAHQWKLYPTETTKFTRILKMRNEGKYKPYAEDNTEGFAYKLVKVLAHSLNIIPPYIRTNRVVRDIPHQSIEGGLKCGNLRQVVDKYMLENNMYSNCIRAREVKLKNIDSNDVKLCKRSYKSSGGIEFFISFESTDLKTLYGFTRLRLNYDWKDVIPELYEHALIQELHVYGEHTPIGSNCKNNNQHRGLGTKLLKIAEEIAYSYKFNKISVISGVGVKQYYRKKGYTDYSTYMTKNIYWYNFPSKIIDYICFWLSIVCFILSLYCYYRAIYS